MSEPTPSGNEPWPPALARRIEQACTRFEAVWQALGASDPRPRIEDYLADAAQPERLALLRELIPLDVAYRRRHGEEPTPAEYGNRFPSLASDWLVAVLAAESGAAQTPTDRSIAGPPPVTQAQRIRCPHCHNPIQLVDDRPDEVLCPGCGSSFRVRDTRLTTTTDGSRPLGKFQLLERVGLGAFGAVWRARDSELDRPVALKIPHTGMLSSASDLERFHREARAAAQLRHPNIVTVHEVTTLDGLPTIVSDFIDGITLKELSQVRRLTCREAALLVADVAEALEYAHSQGAVHRDIKPANIMVEYGRPAFSDSDCATRTREGRKLRDTIGRPMIMDFGLALRDEAEVTMTLDGQIIGTPAYMSPEQAAGHSHSVDRRTDVYSLGVVLFEMLCGELPFRGSRAMLVYQVLNQEPRAPRSLDKRIPRDLETICLKAMAKEPRFRYQTAGELAADLRRFINGEPILARPVGRVVRLARTVRRHSKVGLAVASAVALAFLGGVLVTQSYPKMAKGQAETSGSSGESPLSPTPDALAADLENEIASRPDEGFAIARHGAEQLGPYPDLVRRLFEKAAELRERRLARLTEAQVIELAEVHADLLRDVARAQRVRHEWLRGREAALAAGDAKGRVEVAGLAWRWLGDRDWAARLCVDALKVDPKLTTAGNLLRDKLNYQLTDRGWLPRPAIPAERPVQVEEGIDRLNSLAMNLKAQRRYAEAESLLRQGLQTYRRALPAEHPQVARILNNLGLVLRECGEFDQAETCLRDALAMCRKLYGAEKYPSGHPDLAQSLSGLGSVLQARGELAQAEALYREALIIRQMLYPPEICPNGQDDLATSLKDLGTLLYARGELAQAEERYREAVAMRKNLYPPETHPYGHADLAADLNDLALVLQARGQFAQAEAFFSESLAMRRKLYPPNKYPTGHPDLAQSLNNVGALRRARYAGLPVEAVRIQAEPFFRDAIGMYERLYPVERYGLGHPDLAVSLANLGFLFGASGDRMRAESYLGPALDIRHTQLRLVAGLYREADTIDVLARYLVTRDGYLSATRPDAGRYGAVWQGKSMLRHAETHRHINLVAGQNPQGRERAATLRRVRAELMGLVCRPLADPDEHLNRLRRLTERKEELERELAHQLKLPWRDTVGAPPHPNNLRAVLPPRTIFVDFLRYVRTDMDPIPRGRGMLRRGRGTPCYVAFVLSRERPPVRVELGEAGPIDRAIKDWRRDISLGDLATQGDSGRRLSGQLWQPLAPHIPTDTEGVYLCPDADLKAVPWAALPGRGPGRVLLEEYTLAVTPDPLYLLEQFQAKPEPAAAGDMFLAYGAVRYDQTPATVAVQSGLQRPTSVTRWAYLPTTEQELAQALAQAGRRAALARRGSQASLAELVRDLPQARWAHLATHGFFAAPITRSMLQLVPQDYERAAPWIGGPGVRAGLPNPLQLSGLVLAGADRKGADSPETYDPAGGIITGEGLLALPLQKLDLVVLSACETGLGDVAGGEGVFGMQRALHAAGARNVVASQWQVGDSSGVALMALYYNYLWDKRLSPVEALRQAQLYLYYHPDEITALAKTRGPKRDVVSVRASGTALKPLPEDQRSKPRAPVKQWAGFLISGVGR